MKEIILSLGLFLISIVSCNELSGAQEKLIIYNSNNEKITSENVNGLLPSYSTPLTRAIIEGDDLNEIKSLIGLGADVNQLDGKRIYPLYASIDRDSYEITKALLEAGADITKITNKGGYRVRGKSVLEKLLEFMQVRPNARRAFEEFEYNKKITVELMSNPILASLPGLVPIIAGYAKYPIN